MRYILIFCFFSTFLFSQDKSSSLFREKGVLSFNPIFAASGYNIPGQGNVLIALELGGDLRYGVDLFEDRYRTGLNSKVFWATGDEQTPNWYYLLGWYNQYNLIHKRRSRLYFELNFQYSNLCLCEAGTYTVEPRQVNNIFYIGLGAAWDIYLHPHWDIKLGYNHHLQINEQNLKLPWGQYLLAGVNFYISPRTKPKNETPLFGFLR